MVCWPMQRMMPGLGVLRMHWLNTSLLALANMSLAIHTKSTRIGIATILTLSFSFRFFLFSSPFHKTQITIFIRSSVTTTTIVTPTHTHTRVHNFNFDDRLEIRFVPFVWFANFDWNRKWIFVRNREWLVVGAQLWCCTEILYPTNGLPKGYALVNIVEIRYVSAITQTHYTYYVAKERATNEWRCRRQSATAVAAVKWIDKEINQHKIALYFRFFFLSSLLLLLLCRPVIYCSLCGWRSRSTHGGSFSFLSFRLFNLWSTHTRRSAARTK